VPAAFDKLTGTKRSRNAFAELGVAHSGVNILHPAAEPLLSILENVATFREMAQETDDAKRHGTRRLRFRSPTASTGLAVEDQVREERDSQKVASHFYR
jgi:hypothetical protein